MTYHYEDAQATAYCFPPSMEEQEAALNGTTAFGVHQDKHGNFSFTSTPILTKSSAPRVTFQKNSLDNKLNGQSSNKCWANLSS